MGEKIFFFTLPKSLQKYVTNVKYVQDGDGQVVKRNYVICTLTFLQY